MRTAMPTADEILRELTLIAIEGKTLRSHGTS
jgi:hypothetical protein